MRRLCFRNSFALLLAVVQAVCGFVVPLQPRIRHYGPLSASIASTPSSPPIKEQEDENNNPKLVNFDLDVALFCGGLAFDAYVEPPAESSRWERGSRGWKVAFVSSKFTRDLYQGLLQIVVNKVTDLPDAPEQDNVAEQIVTGKGVDACVLVAVLEGSWKDDLERLSKQQNHDGVLELSGAAHVGRTSTAWANVDERASELSRRQRGVPLPYHIPATWGKGGQAIWPEIPVNNTMKTPNKSPNKGNKGEPIYRSNSFYLYVQDPATAQLVFTVADDNRVGERIPIGSTYKRLDSLIPQVNYSPETWLKTWKSKIQKQMKNSANNNITLDPSEMQATWQGELPLTSKPRKKDKNSQIIAGATAGAYLAGPMGAAAGALIGSFYEGQVRGRIHCRINYLPILKNDDSTTEPPYQVLGGMPGIDWGTLFQRHFQKMARTDAIGNKLLRVIHDLEHVFFVNHDVTGATCAVYRSLQEKVVVVSFRGTCAPIDLLTDTTLTQDAWVQGQDITNPTTVKVHAGFRNSLDSIARRLKELLLATPAPGESIEDYDMLVTGHSLGGALATLFVADVGQYGLDAGRGLPGEPSEPWWVSIASTFMGQQSQDRFTDKPPRPNSLRLYNFGSPRVGNQAWRDLFDSLLQDGYIDQAYRIVNGDDVVARLPRTMNALVFGSVGYEHVGTTVLVSDSDDDQSTLWVEGESDDSACPVRDAETMFSPVMADGTLLSDLMDAARTSFLDEIQNATSNSQWPSWDRLSAAASKVTERIQSLSATDVATVLGIDRQFTDREFKMIQSLVQGKALAHHMEDQYYTAMGRASGFEALVGYNITELKERNDIASEKEE